jgi:hypothetical protein
VLINVLVSGNTASDGGGIENSQSSPVLINVTIAGNRVATSGGGMYNTGSYSEARIHNSIIWGNAATSGPAFSNNDGSNMDISYSIIQDIDTDPLFIDPDPATAGSPTTGGNYRLSATSSPAKDTGLDTHYPIDSNGDWDTSSPVYVLVTDTAIREKIRQAVIKDLGRVNNRFNGNIDMGAYEY